MSPVRPSARMAGPGPVPADEGRTPEQRAALGTGVMLLLACALTFDLATRAVTGSRGGLVVSLIPLTYLGAGWLLFLLGLVKLSGDRLRGSRSRGPWLPVGFAFAILCAPLTASFEITSDQRLVRYTCACGGVVEARGTQNCWGFWLTQSTKLVGLGPRGSNAQALLCEHSAHTPWD